MDFSGAVQVISNFTSAGGSSTGSSFEAMVRSANVLLRNATATDIRDIALNQAYPRIGLVLAAAKTKNGFLFDGGDRYNTVLDVIDPAKSIYAAGIRRVAAYLTAAVMTRNIPLQGDLNQIAVGDNMESQAIADLDRIIALISDDRTNNINADLSQSSPSLYLSLGIDTSTINSNFFDAADPDAPTDQDGSGKSPIELFNVNTYKTVPFQGEGVKAFCWFYLTGTEGVLANNPSIESIFEVRTDNADNSEKGFTSQEIIQTLSDRINTATLSVSSNIIVAPNKGPDITRKLTFPKIRLFPSTTTNRLRIASLNLYYNVNFLNFDVRRYSNVVSRELIILGFYTISINTLTSLGISSLSSVISSQIRTIRNSASVGIKGVWYGTAPDYVLLDEKGPNSLIIQVEKTHASLTAGSSAASEKEKDQLLPNTFYFQKSDPSLPLTGILRWRASTTPPLDKFSTPETTDTISTEYSINLDNLNITTSEDLALNFLQSMYGFTKESTEEYQKKYPEGLIKNSTATQAVTAPNQGNNILGALVQTNAVEIVAFRALDYTYKAIIDIVQVPNNLLIATGTPLQLKSAYISGPRSVVVEAIPLKTNLSSSGGSSISNSQTDKQLLEENPSTAQGVRTNKSARLQSVYDRLDFLKNKGLSR